MKKLSGLLMAILAVTSTATVAQAELIYGLTNLNNNFFSFDSATPGTTSALISLTGFTTAGETLDSIDTRPATGQLFGLSSNKTLYTINVTNGVLTQIGTGPIPTGANGRLTTIDFNPTVDRIRVLESTGNPNNFRANPNDGSLSAVDGNVAFGAGDTNVGDTPNIVAAAYTNSVAGATTTTLYGIDTGNDVLVTQNPANAGTLQTVGPLGFDFGNIAGFTAFDISGQTGVGYVVGNTVGFVDPRPTPPVANQLYTINLSTGALTAAGNIGLTGQQIKGLAVAGVSAVPEPSSMILFAICVGAGAYEYIRRKKAKSIAEPEQVLA